MNGAAALDKHRLIQVTWRMESVTRKERAERKLRCPGPCGQDVVARPTGFYAQLTIDAHLDDQRRICDGSWLPPPADLDHPSVQEARWRLGLDKRPSAPPPPTPAPTDPPDAPAPEAPQEAAPPSPSPPP